MDLNPIKHLDSIMERFLPHPRIMMQVAEMAVYSVLIGNVVREGANYVRHNSLFIKAVEPPTLLPEESNPDLQQCKY